MQSFRIASQSFFVITGALLKAVASLIVVFRLCALNVNHLEVLRAETSRKELDHFREVIASRLQFLLGTSSQLQSKSNVI